VGDKDINATLVAKNTTHYTRVQDNKKMKRLIKSIPALLMAAIISTPAAAYTIDDINSGIYTPDVMFSVQGEVAILEGHVANDNEKERLEGAAKRLQGINGVLNLLSVVN